MKSKHIFREYEDNFENWMAMFTVKKKTLLRLESAPVVTAVLNKGYVF